METPKKGQLMESKTQISKINKNGGAECVCDHPEIPRDQGDGKNGTAVRKETR